MAVERKQEAFRRADEEMVLVGVARGFQSAGAQILSERGEIHMRGDVLFADGLEGVVVAPVRSVAGESAISSVRGEEFLPRHAVVDGEEKTSLEAGGNGGEKFALACAKLRNEILGGRRPSEIQNLGGLEAECAVEDLDALEFPAVCAGLDDVERQGVEEFVGKMDAREIWQSLGCFDPLHAAPRKAV